MIFLKKEDIILKFLKSWSSFAPPNEGMVPNMKNRRHKWKKGGIMEWNLFYSEQHKLGNDTIEWSISKKKGMNEWMTDPGSRE